MLLNTLFQRGVLVLLSFVLMTPLRAVSAPQVKTVSYSCAAGQTITVKYQGNRALVSYAGRTYRMKQARSADGVRYVGGTLVGGAECEQTSLRPSAGNERDTHGHRADVPHRYG